MVVSRYILIGRSFKQACSLDFRVPKLSRKHPSSAQLHHHRLSSPLLLGTLVTMLSRSTIGRQAQRALRQQTRGLAAPASGSFSYETGTASGVKFASRDVAGPTTTLALVSKAGTRYESLPGLSLGLQAYAFKVGKHQSPLTTTSLFTDIGPGRRAPKGVPRSGFRGSLSCSARTSPRTTLAKTSLSRPSFLEMTCPTSWSCSPRWHRKPNTPVRWRNMSETMRDIEADEAQHTFTTKRSTHTFNCTVRSFSEM